MSDGAPRRTFPKKASSFSMNKDRYMKKAREASYGGRVLQRKPARYFTADLTEERETPARNKSTQKVAGGMKRAKNGKVKNGGMKKVKKQRGEAIKGTCIEHKMLGGSVMDDLYASEDDLVDVSDMIDDVKIEAEDDLTTVPVANNKCPLTSGMNTIREENDELSSIAKKSPKKATNSKSKAFADDDEDENEKVVEWSTGRGSARLAGSDDSDEDLKVEPVGNKKKKKRIGPKQLKASDDSGSDFEQQIHERDRKSSRHFDNMPLPMDEGDDAEGEVQDEVAAFRAEMANLPLGKVREMKEKLGLRLFNKAYFGTKADDEKKEQMKRKAIEEKKQERRGQHRPKEISSKVPVSVFRPVYDMSKKKKRDPRFDNRAGEFKERCFEDNYSFLNDLRRQEREELSKQAAECDEQGDTDMAEKIREAIRRMDNRERTKAERKLKEETYKELRQENIERMMRGERPVFKTKAKVRLMQMEKKFEQLKKNNKLDNYMKRKAKKEARKEAKRKPGNEQMSGFHE